MVVFAAAQVWVFPTPAASGASDVQETRTFLALADTYSKADEPDRNFGTSWQMRVDASPDMRGFLRFDPAGLGTPVSQAVLRIYANSASYGIDVRSVSDHLWEETTLTHSNRPQTGPAVASSGRILAGTWAEWDVTSLVSGNDPVSFALTTTSSTATSLAARESGATVPELVVTFGEGDGGGGPDTTRPSAPAELTASAVSPVQVDLSWNASTDNVGVTGYEIFRNGSLQGTTTGDTSYSDTTVSPSTRYEYQVRARDEAGNRSEFSNIATVTTPDTGDGPTTRVFYAVADTYSKSDEPERNFGRSAQIRVDASPDMRGFLRFEVTNIDGPPVSATLRLYANSSNSLGIDVRGVSDDPWGETTLTYHNMPGVGAVVDSSGRITAGSWVEWDVMPLISGNFPVSFALTTTSATATSLAARETGLTRPELIVSYHEPVWNPAPPPDDLEPSSGS